MIDTNMCVELIVNNWKLLNDLAYIECPPEKYMLNETGTKIWKMINGYSTVNDIILKLENEDTSSENIENIKKYVIEFIEQIIENNLAKLRENGNEEW